MPDMPLAEAQPLGYLLHRTGAVLGPAVSAALQPLELTLPALVCMKILSVFPGMSNAELARANNITPQSMNIVVKALQGRGLVTRPASVSSGRALPTQLTREGKTLLKRAEAAVAVAEDQVLADLTAAQRRELKRLLGKIGGSAVIPGADVPALRRA
jgi:DNA-binding MarR family transcriptional regulator